MHFWKIIPGHYVNYRRIGELLRINGFLNKKEIHKGILIFTKARLVIKGDSQLRGFDYKETYSPVARLETVRVLFSIIVSKGLITEQLDVNNAFLNGDLMEEIYMQKPDGFEDGSKYVCRLNKALYGLKQATRV